MVSAAALLPAMDGEDALQLAMATTVQPPSVATAEQWPPAPMRPPPPPPPIPYTECVVAPSSRVDALEAPAEHQRVDGVSSQPHTARPPTVKQCPYTDYRLSLPGGSALQRITSGLEHRSPAAADTTVRGADADPRAHKGSVWPAGLYTAVECYSAEEVGEDGALETGYLPITSGAMVEMMCEQCEQPGHSKNRYDHYLYGKANDKMGWFPTDVLRSPDRWM